MKIQKNIKNILRTVIIILGIILFIFVLFWALLKANGRKIYIDNILNPENTGPMIINTGGIRINNNEFKGKIKAYINGQEKPVKDNKIEDLNPGKMQIALQVDEHTIWKSQIKIESGLITDIYPFFFPKEFNLESKLDSTSHIDKVFFSENNEYIYYVIKDETKGANNGIFQYNLQNTSNIFNPNQNNSKKLLNIIPEIEKAISNGDYELIPSPDNQKLIFKSNMTPHYIIDLNTIYTISSDYELNSIEEILGYTPENFNWFKGSSSLIIQHDKLVYELILSTKKLIIITHHPEYTPIFGINGHSVIYFSPIDNSLYAYKDESKTQIIIENQKIPTNIINIIVDKLTGNYLIIETQDSEFYYLNTIDSYFEKIETNITPIQFSPDGSGLIYEKDGKVYSYIIQEVTIKNLYLSNHYLILNEYEKEKIDIEWNNLSSHLLIYDTINNSAASIDIIDKKGENSINILKSNNIIKNSFKLINDNTELIVLMKNTNNQIDTSNNTSKNNIYSVNLEQ